MSSSHGRRPTSASAAAAPPEGGRQPPPQQTPSEAEARSSTTATAAPPKAVPPPQEFTRVTLVDRGIFTGKYMSFCLQVAQQPVSGRRKTDKDRRPVAPTPIIRLWIREHKTATGPGVLVNPSDIDVSALVCAVDLVEPNSPTSPGGRPGRAPRSTGSPSPPRPRLSISTADPAIPHRSQSTSMSPRDAPIGLGIGGVGGMWQGQSTGGAGGGGGAEWPQAESSRQGAGLALTSIPRPRSRQSPFSPASGGDDETSSEEEGSPALMPAVAPGSRPTSASRPASGGSEASRGGTRRGRGRSATAGEPARPGSGRRTGAYESARNLHGRLHIEPNRVIDMDGAMGLWFLFMNLSIRNEGTYSFHFRCFDRSATAKGMPPAPYLASCRSKDFKVFSPRNYQGRPPNTPLADHFNRQGFKLNTRKNERQVASPTASSPQQE